jgi:8-amino-7-oxononanoate synthase
MGLRSRIIDRGRQLVQSPAVMRWVSDDRVMKAAEGVLDAKARVRLAWHMLKNGHALPPVDPALDDSIGETVEHVGNGSSRTAAARLEREINGATNGKNAHARNGSGSNGNVAEALGSAAQETPRRRPSSNGNGGSSNGGSMGGLAVEVREPCPERRRRHGERAQGAHEPGQRRWARRVREVLPVHGR